MFNSVAKYLWGSSSEAEQDKAGQRPEETSVARDDVAHHDTVEQLDTQAVEDDWEIVGTPMELLSDEENNGESSHHPSSHHHHAHHHIHNHHHPARSGTAAGPQGDGSPCWGANGETEVLDDAAALAQSLSLASSDRHADDEDFSDFDHKREHFAEPQPLTPLQDCGLTNMDLDSNYSSDNESSPESVFSACSGRSHATYRPGSSSEAWVIAPAPCFTGSQVGELSPIASSPLENLLIEHPSMSVYLTVPPSSLPASHPFLSNRLSSDGVNSTEAMAASSEDVEVENHDRETTPVAEGGEENRSSSMEAGMERLSSTVRLRHGPQAPIHAIPATIEQIAKIEHAAQRSQTTKSQKKINSRKLERENRVHQTPTKNKNRRNKNTRPSGMRASRFTQRV